MKAREEFAAQFSRRSFSDLADLPVIPDPARSVVEVVKALGFAASNGEVRRVAEQKGLRLVSESGDQQEVVTLTAEEAREPLAALVAAKLGDRSGERYLKVGRKLARIDLGS